MSVVEGPRSSAGLVARVQNILMKPTTEWDVIAAEPATISGLYSGYAAVLAAIPAIATVIGGILWRHSLIGAVLGGVLGYVLNLVGLYVIAFIIDALAASFKAEKNQIQAFKLATYSSTASWIAGAGGIFPGPLASLIALLGGLYSLYLLYLGLPKLMKAPEDQTIIYLVVIIVVAVIVYAVIAAVLGLVLATLAVGAVVGGAAAFGGIH
jgi:hypothetical protein